MTEEQAKKKACPIFSVSAAIGLHTVFGMKKEGAEISQETVAKIGQGGNCCASGCMMWTPDQGTVGASVGRCGLCRES